MLSPNVDGNLLDISPSRGEFCQVQRLVLYCNNVIQIHVYNGEHILMRDITNTKVLYLKGFLFVVGCVSSMLLIILDNPSIKTIFLLGVAIWCAARVYYFMFYVIEHYIDETYTFSGIIGFLQYLLKKRAK